MCDYLNEAGATGAAPCKLDFDREYIRRRGIGARTGREKSRRRQRSTGCSQPDWLVELSVPFASANAPVFPVIDETEPVDPTDGDVQMARSEGFEPPTLGIEIRCSIQLSYERVQSADYQTWPGRASRGSFRTRFQSKTGARLK